MYLKHNKNNLYLCLKKREHINNSRENIVTKGKVNIHKIVPHKSKLICCKLYLKKKRTFYSAGKLVVKKQRDAK